jgi:hypothetical protein
MSPLEKAVMDAFIGAATRHEPVRDCVRAAGETWIALNPSAPPTDAIRSVHEILARLRLVEDEGSPDAASEAERQRVIAAWRQAEAIGLHPDNCFTRAVELWLKEHPANDRPTAERRVADIIDLARTKSS